MKDRTKTAITVAVGFGLASLILWTSPSFQSCIYEHQNHASHGASQEYVGRFLIFYEVGRGCTGEWIHKHGEALITLFTIILGIATWLLWRATKALVEGADKTAKRQLRAYVFIDGGSFKLIQTDKDRIFVENVIVMKNFGQTPAYSFSSRLNLRVMDANSSIAEETSKGLGGTIIGPGSERHLSAKYGPISNADVDGIRNGTKAIFTWGRIDYIDAFGDPQWFIFDNKNGNEVMTDRGGRSGEWPIYQDTETYQAT